MPKERKSPIAIAHEMTGVLKCPCGAVMELRERHCFETQTMQAYLVCEACGKHTATMEFDDSEPLARIMAAISSVKKGVDARGKTAVQGL